MHHNLEKSNGDTFKCTMDNPILLVSICMGKSIRIQKVKLGVLAFILWFCIAPVSNASLSAYFCVLNVVNQKY